jgi:MFS family permease
MMEHRNSNGRFPTFMNATPHPPALAQRRRLLLVLLITGLMDIGATLLLSGIFFYTEHEFGWGPLKNLLLASAQGVMYIGGALLAHPLTLRGRRWGPMGVLAGLQGGMTLFALIIMPVASSPAAMVALLLVYTLISAAVWPILESLVTRGADPHQMSRRVSIYNLVWSGGAAVTVALTGTILHLHPLGLFLVAALSHTMAGALAYRSMRDVASSPTTGQSFHPDPEPQLQRIRQLALWLARVSLPAVFVLGYSLLAMLPSLPVLEGMTTANKTLIASIWMAARFLAFVLAGMTTAWHTRPRLLLAASALMLLSFWGITLRPSDLLNLPGLATGGIDLASMIIWQVALGLSMGMIYSGSLYFGMVLSDGSTEHGGYHEALIGLGAAIGPGVGALTQSIWPGQIAYGVAGVSAVMMVTLALGIVVQFRFRRT